MRQEVIQALAPSFDQIAAQVDISRLAKVFPALRELRVSLDTGCDKDNGIVPAQPSRTPRIKMT